ncbi:hypothetical protein L1D31_04210 [Vibrio sp. Isolate23]|uniref:hypothetical protein n=1 Tax=Vibrio sp. Isolate23 TaxID=2908533 RepID=UPI001EFC69AE|nr:hypothetical protein [Vibrio sp. Isolate23]MCG9681766.1 hypothetical protein [Vibrio sp. Isolate23]
MAGTSISSPVTLLVMVESSNKHLENGVNIVIAVGDLVDQDNQSEFEVGSTHNKSPRLMLNTGELGFRITRS